MVEGLFRGPRPCPDLETFFRKMLFRIFLPGKMRSKSVLAYRRKQPHYRTRNNDPKNQRVATSGYQKPGSSGEAPGVLSSDFLQRKPGSPAGVGGGTHVAGPTLRQSRRPPPGAGRATGRCAPRLRKSPDHPKGTQYHTAPRRGSRPLTSAAPAPPEWWPHRVPTVSRAPRAAPAGDFFRPLGWRSLAASHTTRGVRASPRTMPHWARSMGTTANTP